MRKTLLLLLSLIGLFDALYLWWVYASPSRPMVCMGGGCDAVRASVFAYPMGVPMPVFGVAMYAGLALLIFADPMFQGRIRRAAAFALAGITGLGLLFSLYLTGLEAFVIHAWCFWCVISAITVTLMFGLAIFDLLRPLPEPDHAVARVQARKQFGLVLAAALVGTPLFYVLMRAGTPPPFPPIPPEVMGHMVRPDSHMTGNLNARLTVLEFGDIQCPACGRAEEVARQMRSRYGDRVRFAFRHFPLPSIHSYAEQAAEASECAAEQGKFWEALDRFYKGQDDLREPALMRYAGEVGLDMNQFRQCWAQGRGAAHVKQDAEDARALGLRSTPTFFIGTQVVEGPIGLEQFSRMIDQELARLGTGQGQVTAAPPPAPGPATTGLNPNSSPPGAFGGGSPFAPQFGEGEAGCSEAEAQKQQATVINTPEAWNIFEATPKAVFVDVREEKAFRLGRIPGAINIPSDKVKENVSRLPKNKTIVLYESGRGSGDVCAAGRAAGRTLLAHGFSLERVKVFQDGLAGWGKAGLPVGH